MALVIGSSEVLEDGVSMPSKVRFVISFFQRCVEGPPRDVETAGFMCQMGFAIDGCLDQTGIFFS